MRQAVEGIKTSVPYATEDATELDLIISRFVSFARKMAVHQNMAAQFGDRNTDHIQLATELRTAMKVSRKNHLYPNIVLPIKACRSFIRAACKSEAITQCYSDAAIQYLLYKKDIRYPIDQQFQI